MLPNETNDRFRIAPMRRFQMGQSLELIYFPLSKLTKIIPHQVANALASCIKFKTLLSHADTLAAYVDCPFTLLNELKVSGGLISYGDVSNPRSNEQPAIRDYKGISSIAIPTSGRGKEFGIALRSCISSASQVEREIEVFVADHSRTAAEQGTIEAIAKDLAISSGISVSYSGNKETCDFINALVCNSAAPREVIEFALLPNPSCRTSIGANRNSILLHTIGQLILSVDDDSICHPSKMIGRDTSKLLTFGSETAEANIQFFTDRQSAMQAVQSASLNIFAEHECLLGRSPTEAISQSAFSSVKFDHPCDHLLESLHHDRGTIPVTYSGVVGDSGMYSTQHIGMYSNHLTRRLITKSQHAYFEAKKRRDVVRQFRSPTICHAGAPMTTTVGFDNRMLLPPFFPKYRNEDGIFAATLRRCLKEAYFGHLAFVLPHDPSGNRINEVSPWLTIRMSDYILQLVAAWPEPIGQGSTKERLMSLGTYLIEIGTQKSVDFLETIRMLLFRRSSRMIERINSLLVHSNHKPEFWVYDLKRQISELSRATIDSRFLLPSDLSHEFSVDQIQPAAQAFVRQFGQLLYWWPEIVSAAGVLAQRGVPSRRKLQF